MGQEINQHIFSAADFERFQCALHQETELLSHYFSDQQFSATGNIGGFELECWLVDKQGLPMPCNQAILQHAQDPLLSPELARFNIELNVDPQPLHGKGLRRLFDDITTVWLRTQQHAAACQSELLAIGILPTVSERDLNLANISQYQRYFALNEQVLKARAGRPLHLDIVGNDHLKTTHQDVMLESATTSFQLHLQVPMQHATRYYNTAILLSAPMVAVSANSPFLFGKDLWDETRIPLFEQAVAVGGYDGAAFGPIRRVTFGSGYARENLMELFTENLHHYPVLLPPQLPDSPQRFPHLRLHNGTIWRWNRALIGFDADDTPHLRIEHRVMPAGPTHIDAMANAALFYGLMNYFVSQPDDITRHIDFTCARDNFYRCARYGLKSSIQWLDEQPVNIASFLQNLLKQAQSGLEQLDIDRNDRNDFLEIISARLRTMQNGAAWQRRYVAVHGNDMIGLVQSYREHQRRGNPVHEWGV